MLGTELCAIYIKDLAEGSKCQISFDDVAQLGGMVSVQNIQRIQQDVDKLHEWARAQIANDMKKRKGNVDIQRELSVLV